MKTNLKNVIYGAILVSGISFVMPMTIEAAQPEIAVSQEECLSTENCSDFVVLSESVPDVILEPSLNAERRQVGSIANNEAGINYLMLVNKIQKLPDDYEGKAPIITVKNSFGREFQIERETHAHFVKLREALLANGIQVELDSVYRSVSRQQEIAKEFTEKYGEDYVKKYVAVPGFSEHHTGMAVDICLVVNGNVIDDNDEMIAQKDIFAQIHPLLPKYGFILRYPAGKEKITGYSYEPWHFRYVGEEAAMKISASNLTLEEYLESMSK